MDMNQSLSDIIKIINIGGKVFGFRALFGSYNDLPEKRSIIISIPKNIKNVKGEILDGEEYFHRFIKNLRKYSILNAECEFKILNKRNEIFDIEPNYFKYEHFKYTDFICLNDRFEGDKVTLQLSNSNISSGTGRLVNNQI